MPPILPFSLLSCSITLSQASKIKAKQYQKAAFTQCRGWALPKRALKTRLCEFAHPSHARPFCPLQRRHIHCTPSYGPPRLSPRGEISFGGPHWLRWCWSIAPNQRRQPSPARPPLRKGREGRLMEQPQRRCWRTCPSPSRHHHSSQPPSPQLPASPLPTKMLPASPGPD